MLIFEKGLTIAFWNASKSRLIRGKIQFKASLTENAYMVDVIESGAIIVREYQMAQVLLKDMFDNDIWVDICDLYASYSHDTVIGPDTIYNRHLTGSRNSGRYPWSESTNNYMLHDEKAVKAFINWNFGRELRITPKKVIFNGPATIVMWEDGTKTIVKKTERDTDDREKAVMYAILKKEFGSRANMNRYLKQFFKEEHDE